MKKIHRDEFSKVITSADSLLQASWRSVFCRLTMEGKATKEEAKAQRIKKKVTEKDNRAE